MPPRPMIEPTDKSMPPLMSSRASGTETIPMIETCSATRRKLSKLTNLSFWLAKNKTSSPRAEQQSVVDEQADPTQRAPLTCCGAQV